jgi:hypothetical protein
MTILNYSGRGRGGGGRGGRGGGGRGYHAGGGRHHPGGRWGGGGGRFAAAAPAASSKWVRPKDSEVIELSKPEPQATIESKVDVDNDDLKPPTITKTETTAVMKKRGRNKLVLNSTVEKTRLKKAPPLPVVNQTTQVVTMTRWGKHKLDLRDPNKILQSDQVQRQVDGVVGKGPSYGRNEVEEEKQGKTISHVENMRAKEKEGDIVHGVGINLKKIGSNKLVMPGKNSTSVERPTRVDQRDMKRQRADHHRHRSDPSAKRIKVAIKESDSHDDSANVTDLQGGSRETTTTTTTTTTTAATTEKLTDFAYRETRKVAQHGGSKKWSSSGGASHQDNVDRPRSMGLVRVPQDQSKTPVCASFLRGLQCTDKYCSKRHDVPPEFAIPICSFFQRQGQCLKGEDCKFRHIKVNQRALVCPNFALLGFCDDKDCVMKHVRQNTNRAISNKNVAAAQAHKKMT